jgi:hypothetical protein
MKYTFIFIITLFLEPHTFAQTDFMPIGGVISAKGSSRSFLGTVVFTSEKDTLCNGATCRKVNVVYKNKRLPGSSYNETRYFQQRGDSIFEYSERSNQLYFRFKNNYAVGDSQLINVNSSYSSTLYIDSVIVSNGVKRFVARIKCVETSNLGTATWFGSFNLYDKFLPDFMPFTFSCYWGDLIVCTPLCYSDSQTFYLTAYYRGSCDSIQMTTAIVEVPDKLTVFPNPANTFVTIESPQTESVTIKIQHINGGMVGQKVAFTPISIDVQDLPNGIYILSTQTDKGFPTIRKLVVHH